MSDVTKLPTVLQQYLQSKHRLNLMNEQVQQQKRYVDSLKPQVISVLGSNKKIQFQNEACEIFGESCGIELKTEKRKEYLNRKILNKLLLQFFKEKQVQNYAKFSDECTKFVLDHRDCVESESLVLMGSGKRRKVTKS